ncbi:MAG TPA: hypothetical protein VKR58_15355 [Aquella sp.]|nr:hypothetical protein [Aquella sp.]
MLTEVFVVSEGYSCGFDEDFYPIMAFKTEESAKSFVLEKENSLDKPMFDGLVPYQYFYDRVSLRE